MVNIAFTVGSLIVILIAVVAREKTLEIPNDTHQVLADTTESQNLENSSLPSETESPVVSELDDIVTSSPTETPKPTASPAPTVNNHDWKYPGAAVLNEGSTIKLSTSDNPKTVVDWYKSEISKRGYHATSVIQTSTNGKVLDKIVAGDDKEQVTIEITQDSPSTQTLITVTEEGSSQSI